MFWALFRKKVNLKKNEDPNFERMEICAIFWLPDMKSALKNQSKETYFKGR